MCTYHHFTCLKLCLQQPVFWGHVLIDTQVGWYRKYIWLDITCSSGKLYDEYFFSSLLFAHRRQVKFFVVYWYQCLFYIPGVAQGVVTGIRGLCNGLGPALFGFIFYLFHVDLNEATDVTHPHKTVGKNNQSLIQSIGSGKDVSCSFWNWFDNNLKYRKYISFKIICYTLA